MNIHFEVNKRKIVRNNGKWGKLYSALDRPVLNSHLKSELIQLDCIDSIFEPKGKTQTIATIFNHLRKLDEHSRVRFEFKRSRVDFLTNVQAKKYFSRIIMQPDEWDRVKRYIKNLSGRLNHFFPEEDLHFIFCEIIRQDSQYDYAFSKNEDALIWEFALKAEIH